MVTKSFRDYTRLVIVTFIFTSNALIFARRLFAPGFPPHGKPEVFFDPLHPVLLSFAVFFWYLVELFEFWKMNYNQEKRSVSIFLLILRLLPFLLNVLLFPQYLEILMPILIVVMAFYSAVYFSPSVGVSLLLCTLAAQFFADARLIDTFRPPAGEIRQSEYLFSIYKLMNTLLIWLLGFFWKRDHHRWRQNQQLNLELQKSQEQLREYAERVADTVMLEERTRLARDIHDSVGHNLTAATIQLSKSEGYFEKDPKVARTALIEARNCIQTGIQDIREVLSTLNNNRQDFDIFSHIRGLVKKLPSEQFTVELDLQGEQKDYNMAVLYAIYRIVQEGITNILKHSGADSVRVSVVLGGESAQVSVEDNGRGFDMNAGQGPLREKTTAAFGLQGLRDRISLVRGEFYIYSQPDRGVRLEAKIPRQPARVIGGKLNEG